VTGCYLSVRPLAVVISVGDVGDVGGVGGVGGVKYGCRSIHVGEFQQF
jgi:hypothetical protein